VAIVIIVISGIKSAYLSSAYVSAKLNSIIQLLVSNLSLEPFAIRSGSVGGLCICMYVFLGYIGYSGG